MDEPTEQEQMALVRLIGRATAEAMRLEDFEALREWLRNEAPKALPALAAEANSERGRKAGINAIATSIWNAVPLPSNGYQPRPRPAPGRNEPCPCGSEEKFKRCCGQVAPVFPSLPPHAVWPALIEFATDQELARYVGDPGLPPLPLGAVALALRERGQGETALGALRSRFGGKAQIDERYEEVLDVYLDLTGDVRGPDALEALADSLLGRLPERLKAVPLRHMIPRALALRETDRAFDLLERLRAADPDDPRLGPLEVATLLAADDLALAAQRARFWLTALRRRGQEEDMAEAVKMLEQAASDPEAAAAEMFADEPPLFAHLESTLHAGLGRPVRPYALDPDAPSVVFGTPPRGVRAAEKAWRKVWPELKPGLVSFDVDLPASLVDEPEAWLTVLREHPEVFDSLDVLDDLALVVDPFVDVIAPSRADTLLHPLLERAAAIVRASLAQRAQPAEVPWAAWENRPALRLLSRLAFVLDDAKDGSQAVPVYEELLRLNRNDNHGHRCWLVNHYLRHGHDARALEVAQRYPGDALVDTAFGHGLALWRLGRREEAEDALRKAASRSPLVVEALLAPKIRRPKLTPGRLHFGGKDEAWTYRQDMRDVWLASPDALEFLASPPKPPAKPEPPVHKKR